MAVDASHSDLEAQLLAAHSVDAKEDLVGLYLIAADGAKDVKRSSFFRTHAWVFALEFGDPRANEIAARLRRDGRL